MNLIRIFGIVFFLIFSMMSVSATLESDNIVYYSFDVENVTGTTLEDLNTNGYDGTCVNMGGNCKALTGLLKNSTEFDGVNDYIDLGTDTYNLRSNDFTVSYWFKTNSTNIGYLFDNYDGTHADNRLFVRMATTGELTFFFDVGASNSIATTGTYNDGNWHHLILQREGTEFRLYVDNVNINNVTGMSGDIDHNNSEWKFGIQVSTYYYDGELDEFSIYDSSLSLSQIDELYNNSNGYNFYPISGSSPTGNTTITILNITANDEQLVDNTYFNVNDITFNATYQVNISDENLVAYYKAENNADDSSGNNNDGTEYNGVSYTSSVNTTYGNAFDFDGVDDYIIFPNVVNMGDTICFWLNSEQYNREIIDLSLSISYPYITFRSDGRILFRTGVEEYKYTSTYQNLNEWYHFCVLTDNIGSNVKVYINGIDETGSSSGNANGIYNNITQFKLKNGFEGLIDEVMIFNKSLTDSEVAQIYQNTYLSFTNSTAVTYNSLADGNYTIQFNITYNDTSELSSIYDYFVDITNPTINNSIPSEINTYNIDISSYLSCDDININSCTIYFDVDGNTLNSTNSNYDFTYNGNQTYLIVAEDLSGNQINESGVIFVNPYQYFYFIDPAAYPITNFNFSGTNYSDYAEVKLYDLGGIGTQNLTFQKYGYETTYIIIELNSTSQINLTSTISDSNIYLHIYDKDTLNYITQTVTIDVVGTSFAGTFTTTNGTITIYNITDIPDSYQLTLTSTDYEDLTYYFTHTGYAAINLSFYMQNDSLTIPIKYIVRDGFGNLMGSSAENPSCLVKISEYQISSNSYVLSTMEYTNSNGEVIFNLDTTKYIKPQTVCSGITTSFNGEKITSTPVYLTVDDEPLEIFPDIPQLSSSLTYTQVDNTTGRFTFTYSDLNNIISEACLNITETTYLSEVFVDEQCLSTASGSINIDFNTSGGKTYHAKSFVTYQGEIIPIKDYIKKIFDAPWDFGIWGILFSLMMIAGLAIGGFFMGKAKGVLVGATIGLWVVWIFGTWSFGATSSLTTWSVLLIVGLIFS